MNTVIVSLLITYDRCFHTYHKMLTLGEIEGGAYEYSSLSLQLVCKYKTVLFIFMHMCDMFYMYIFVGVWM